MLTATRAVGGFPLRVLMLLMIESGTYQYFRHGQRANILETWQRSEGRIYSQREAKEFGAFISVECIEREGQIINFEVAWRNSREGAIKDAHALYTIAPNKISVTRTIENVRDEAHYEVKEPLVVSPLLRVFTGKTIKEIERLGAADGSAVLVPWILNPRDRAKLLTPIFDRRSVKRLSVDGDLEKYEYVGGQYDATAEFWLDPQELMVRYVWNEWDVQLVR